VHGNEQARGRFDGHRTNRCAFGREFALDFHTCGSAQKRGGRYARSQHSGDTRDIDALPTGAAPRFVDPVGVIPTEGFSAVEKVQRRIGSNGKERELRPGRGHRSVDRDGPGGAARAPLIRCPGPPV
jgi:hypothetical protein